MFTAGIWIGDAWVVVFVLFLLAFPDGRVEGRFDLFVIGMFALMAFPLELAWLLFFQTGGSPENALAVWPNDGVAGNVDSAQRALVVLASVVLAVTLMRRSVITGHRCEGLSGPSSSARPASSSGPTPWWRSASSGSSSRRRGRGDRRRVHRSPARRPGGHPPLSARALDRRRPFVECGPTRTSELRDALARTLRDPSLELAYWLRVPELSDLDGRSVELPRTGGTGDDDDRPNGARVAA